MTLTDLTNRVDDAMTMNAMDEAIAREVKQSAKIATTMRPVVNGPPPKVTMVASAQELEAAAAELLEAMVNAAAEMFGYAPPDEATGAHMTAPSTVGATLAAIAATRDTIQKARSLLATITLEVR